MPGSYALHISKYFTCILLKCSHTITFTTAKNFIAWFTLFHMYQMSDDKGKANENCWWGAQDFWG